VRRVDGRSFQKMLHDEIGAPLQITQEFFVGIPDEVEPRVAILEAKTDESANQPLPHDANPQAIPALVQPLHEWMNRPDARRACIPASNGIMTARAIARPYAALLPGGVDGVELLPPERIRLATETQWPGNAKPGDQPPGHRLGYGVGTPFSATSTIKPSTRRRAAVTPHGTSINSIGRWPLRKRSLRGFLCAPCPSITAR